MTEGLKSRGSCTGAIYRYMIIVLALAVVLSALITRIAAAPFRITSLIRETNVVDVACEAVTNDYYILLKGSVVTNIQSAADIKLGAVAAVMLVDPDPSSDHAFYRAVRIPQATPRDTDGDGVDDVFELRREYLDALDAADGKIDHDGDGIATYIEYGYETDPGDSNSVPDVTTGLDSDGDGFQDVYEIVHFADRYNPTSMPTATIYVDAAAVGFGDGSVTNPYPDIKSAFEVAGEYDIIEVADGVYTGVMNRALSFPNAAPVMLMSKNGPAGCVIDCEHDTYAISFSTIPDSRWVLDGVTVRHGSATRGGAFNAQNASPLVRGCRLIDNSAEDYGGAVYAQDTGRLVLENCFIKGNTSGIGGGISLWASGSVLRNCFIVENTAGKGGGIHLKGVPCTLQNCTIAGNVGSTKDGSLHAAYAGAVASLTNCIVWGNLPSSVSGTDPIVAYSTFEGGHFGQGNQNVDPRLTIATYRLRGESPCIDTGTSNAPPSDADGELRWDAPAHSNAVSVVDMGADEFVDIDGDGLGDAWERVHFGDLAHGADEDDDAGAGPDGLTNLKEYGTV